MESSNIVDVDADPNLKEEVLLLPALSDDQKEDNDNESDNVQLNVTEESVGADGATANVTKEVESDDDEEDHIIDVSELTDNEDEETLQAGKNVKFFSNIEDSIEKDLEPPIVDVKYSDAYTTVDKIRSDEEDIYLSTSDDEVSEGEHGKRTRTTHKAPNCPWQIYLAMDPPTESWMVKTFVSEHTCHSLLKKNKRCSSTVAAQHLVKEKIGKAFKGDCKMEYADCRRVIGLDGAFLKGAFKGVLLVTVSRNANNQMYPFAWAAVEGETIETWIWFLEELQRDIVIRSGNAEYRTCARHKYANFRKNNGGKELKVAFWRCVKANTEYDFNRALTELGRIKPSAIPAIMSTHPRFWSKPFFKEDSKCDVVNNNMCEVFNGLILEVRHKVIFSMLEDLRAMCARRMVARREYGTKKFVGNFGPKIWAKIVATREGSKRCTLLWLDGNGYEVDDNGEATYIVNVERKTCTCRVWNMTGIPCRHAVTVISHIQENVEDYVAHWYSKQIFMASYEYEVPVIEGMDQWKETKMPHVQPPNLRRCLAGQRRNDSQKNERGKHLLAEKGVQNEDQATPQEKQPQDVDENIGAKVENPMSQVEDPLSQVLNEAPTPKRFRQTARRKQEVCEGSSKNAQPWKRAKKDCATTTTGLSQSQAATTLVAKDKGKQPKKLR
ncbi:hypothetical protein SLEP1_g17025 [Rubroshorea leprosula]|uniref:SWIM-type domain-containing protein n=1 Tax=Rubroshorea leprosula TaxID=152421 RepID=A0AAV5IWL1_9ROSI|nr:hypothetical protein SLEP1_g17025 [Rubroshorea leprosula]